MTIEKLDVLVGTQKNVVGDFEEDFVSSGSRVVVNRADDFAEVGIGKGMADLRDENRDEARSLRLKSLGEAAGAVAKSLDGRQDPIAGGLADPPVTLVEDKRDRGQAGSAFSRYVLDTNGLTFRHGSSDGVVEAVRASNQRLGL